MNTSRKLSLFVITISCVAFFLCGNGCKKSEPPRDSASEIEWIYSVPEGLALAKEKGKPVFIDFYADWCVICKQMDQTTFRDKRVMEELARFITIKADLTNSTSQGQPAAKKYEVQFTPTYVFIDTQGKQTTELGYRPPDGFLRILKSIK